LETKTYTKKELAELINSDQFYNLINLPISKQRAISQINNPRASENDVLLVVVYDENKVAGYLGILPDYLFWENNKEKVGWLTCFWVDDEYKSRNVAANLFLRVIRAWDKKIFITNIVPWLEPVYQKTNIFQPTIYKKGFRGYLRFNFSEILPPKKKIFENIIPILKTIDFTLNLIHDIRLSLFIKHKYNNVRYEYLSTIDEKTVDFIDIHKIKYWNQRGKSELEWIMQYPWIIQGAKKDYNSSRYYFTSLCKRFYYQLVRFSVNKDLIGVILISIRENNLSVPYVFVETRNIDEISKFLINTMIELRLNMLTTFNYDLVCSIDKIKSPFYFKKVVKKPYFIFKKFEFIKDLCFQDGDGDCAFY
jgi:hypothetical protein